MNAAPDPDRDPRRFARARRRALWAWLALLVLLLASAGSAQLHWGGANLVVSLLIAAVKIAIVGWVFMALGEAHRLPRLAAAIGVAVLTVMVGLGAVDALARRDEATRWQSPQALPARLTQTHASS
ncbi:MAG TPA: cytochrome C oxidase subunit IV family protein, partial [Burkholderiaceae bacterium]